jgi:hypothetical protein
MNLSQDGWSPGRDLNSVPPEHKVGVLTIRIGLSINVIFVKNVFNYAFVPQNVRIPSLTEPLLGS